MKSRRVGVFIIAGNGAARRTCNAMAAGAKACGELVTVQSDIDYRHVDDWDVAIFWGYIETCQKIMADFRAAGKPAIYLDLAYWERTTHYKVSVNGRHPTIYFQNHIHPDDRRCRFGVDIKPYRRPHENSDPILLAGMGAKAAWAEKEEPVESWEKRIVEELRKFTDRPIIYRPKPSFRQARPIKGTSFSPPNQSIYKILSNAHAVVTHHSNVAVDGLVEGVSAFAWYGVASVMAFQDLSRIENPIYPDGREQWLNDIAYCQWSLAEMEDGTVWRHLLKEELI